MAGKVRIRMMQSNEDERQTVRNVARKVFGFPFSLFIEKPEYAAIAVDNDKIHGGAIYKYYDIGKRRVGYLAWGFVNREARGKGYGRQTYRMAVQDMQDNECKHITSLIHFENAPSFRALAELDDFQKATYTDLIRAFGFFGAIKFIAVTFAKFSPGHDIWISGLEKRSNNGPLINSLTYFVLNSLLLGWLIFILGVIRGNIPAGATAAVGGLMLFSRYLGGLIGAKIVARDFRVTTPRYGFFTPFLFALNPVFIMSAIRWIPQGLRWNVNENKKKLAIPVIGSLFGTWLVIGLSFCFPYFQSEITRSIFLWHLGLNTVFAGVI